MRSFPWGVGPHSGRCQTRGTARFPSKFQGWIPEGSAGGEHPGCCQQGRGCAPAPRGQPQGIAHPGKPPRARLCCQPHPGKGLRLQRGPFLLENHPAAPHQVLLELLLVLAAGLSRLVVKAFGNRVFVSKELFRRVQDAKFTSQILRNPQGPSCYSRAPRGLPLDGDWDVVSGVLGCSGCASRPWMGIPGTAGEGEIHYSLRGWSCGKEKCLGLCC